MFYTLKENTLTNQTHDNLVAALRFMNPGTHVDRIREKLEVALQKLGYTTNPEKLKVTISQMNEITDLANRQMI